MILWIGIILLQDLCLRTGLIASSAFLHPPIPYSCKYIFHTYIYRHTEERFLEHFASVRLYPICQFIYHIFSVPIFSFVKAPWSFTKVNTAILFSLCRISHYLSNSQNLPFSRRNTSIPIHIDILYFDTCECSKPEYNMAIHFSAMIRWKERDTCLFLKVMHPKALLWKFSIDGRHQEMPSLLESVIWLRSWFYRSEQHFATYSI